MGPMSSLRPLLFIIVSLASYLCQYAAEVSSWRPVVLKVETDGEIDELKESGAIILRTRENLVLAYIPEVASRSIGGGMRAGRGVRRMNVPALDVARSKFGAQRVLNGDGLPSPFDGRGVVVGFCDVGFDATHPAFKTDGGYGRSRIKKIVQYRESQGERIEYASDEGIAAFVTDDSEEYHATHVGGILAGTSVGNGYGGVASGAEIVATMSELSDVGLLAGVEDIIEYAHSVNKPAVVNISVSSYCGSHDGTSLFSQYLDLLGKEAIICISAGNEGNHSNTLPVVFSEDFQVVDMRIGNTKWNNFEMYGAVDVWCDDDSPVEFSLGIFEDARGEVVHRIDGYVSLPDGGSWRLAAGDAVVAEGDYSDEMFSAAFDGYISVSGGVNPDNGRYNLAVEYDIDEIPVDDRGPWAKYTIVITLKGRPGAACHAYADGIYTRLSSVPGNPSPGSVMSVSDLACGYNVISVGMYNSRNEVPLVYGGSYQSSWMADEVNVHSGYGALIDGRVTPLTVAPGAEVVSSMSSPWLARNPEKISGMSAVHDVDGTKVYWGPSTGTSMSSPYVAGFIATWLQADPTLEISDVKRIISNTNVRDYPDLANPRHGDGWFNPYSGLLAVLGESSVIEGLDTADRFEYSVDGRVCRLYVPGGNTLMVEVYDVSGLRVFSKNIEVGVSELDFSTLAPGWYIAKIDSGEAVRVVRILLK